MGKAVKYLALFIILIVLLFGFREIFPKTETVRVVNIETKVDTVPKVEFKYVELPPPPPDTLPPTIITVTEVDTVWVDSMPPVVGATRIVARGLELGDTLDVQGFELTQDQDNPGVFLRREWRVSYFITGPLQSVAIDSVPPTVTFFDESRKDSNKCPYLLRVIPLPCDPALEIGGGYLLEPTPSIIPVGAWVKADAAIGNKRFRVGALATTEFDLFVGVSFRF